ncbi:MAG TPA: PilZ domain-containing protein [Polyangia bacterium]|nr:PilZ domain-containing protein [Polyangia bacterium]
MGHDSGEAPRPTAATVTTAKRSALSADEVKVFTERAPRCRVSLQVLCTVPGEQPGADAEVVDGELVNLSSSGMLLSSAQLLPVGAVVDFEFKLDERLVALSGRAEVARSVAEPPRMGLRFVALDGAARDLVQRLVEVSDAAPDVPTTPGFAPPAVEFDHGAVRVRLTAATASFFTYNPLLHVGIGGCFLPAESDVPLGTGYQVDILDSADHVLVRCKAKVAAKQDRWIGIRFLDIERSALQALRAEVAKLSGPRVG